jgi:hypothetical protein
MSRSVDRWKSVTRECVSCAKRGKGTEAKSLGGRRRSVLNQAVRVVRAACRVLSCV